MSRRHFHYIIDVTKHIDDWVRIVTEKINSTKEAEIDADFVVLFPKVYANSKHPPVSFAIMDMANKRKYRTIYAEINQNTDFLISAIIGIFLVLYKERCIPDPDDRHSIIIIADDGSPLVPDDVWQICKSLKMDCDSVAIQTIGGLRR